MQYLFTALTHAVEGGAILAVTASFVWGVLSVLLSPCHLASIPLIVGFIDNQGPLSPRRALYIATLFAIGILVSIALIGVVTAAAGRMLGDIGSYGNYVVAGIFFLVGLTLLDIVPIPWSGPGQVGLKRKGPAAAFVLGLVFGIALGPCSFAFMAPMLAMTFTLAATNLAYGIMLLLAYALGHCAVIVAAGASTTLVQRVLDWTVRSRAQLRLKTICAVLVLLGGLYLIYTAP